MSINIVPRPDKPSETQSTSQSSQAKSARERAIAKLSGNKPEAAPAKAAEIIEQSAPQEPKVSLEDAVSEQKEVQENTIESSDSIDSLKASEVTKSEEEVKSESKDPLSSHYAAMARKEKALRAKVQQQELQFKAKEEAIRAKEEALKAKEEEYKSGYFNKAEFSKDPWKYLAEAGITYDQLTEMALTQQSVPPQVMSQIQKLEKQLQEEREERKKYEENSKKSQEEAQSNAYKQAVEALKRDASSLVKDNPEFELVASTDSVQDVVTLIEETFKEEGILLSVEEAAAEVEKYLEEEALKLAKLKKIQSKLQPTQSKTEEGKVEVKFQAKQPQMKTLTNSIGQEKPLTARERAILAMKGDLKK